MHTWIIRSLPLILYSSSAWGFHHLWKIWFSKKVKRTKRQIKKPVQFSYRLHLINKYEVHNKHKIQRALTEELQVEGGWGGSELDTEPFPSRDAWPSDSFLIASAAARTSITVRQGSTARHYFLKVIPLSILHNLNAILTFQLPLSVKLLLISSDLHLLQSNTRTTLM